MPSLKLSKLPNRTPVKITITVAPEVNAALQAYAELYREAYGENEPVAALIPYMLRASSPPTVASPGRGRASFSTAAHTTPHQRGNRRVAGPPRRTIHQIGRAHV